MYVCIYVHMYPDFICVVERSSCILYHCLLCPITLELTHNTGVKNKAYCSKLESHQFGLSSVSKFRASPLLLASLLEEVFLVFKT